MSKTIAIVFLILSMIGFAGPLHLERAALQASPMLPLPPVGYTVADFFEVDDPAEFQIEARVPSRDTGQIPMNQKPPLGGEFEVQLVRQGDKPITLRPSLHHGGENGFSKLDLYFSDPITLAPGSYDLRLKTLLAPPAASALITLSPVRDQSASLVAKDLLRLGAWCFLAMALAVVLLDRLAGKMIPSRSMQGTA